MAADGGSFAAAFPQPGSPYGAPQGGGPMPQGTAMMPAPGMGTPPYAPYGAPAAAPPQAAPAAPPGYDVGGMGAPQPNPYGTPVPPNPFGGPPPGYAPSAAYGGAPPQAYGAPPATGMAPYNAPPAGLAPMMGQPLPTASAGPQRRNALMTFLMPVAVVVAGSIVGAILGMILRPLGIVGNLLSLAGSVWTLLIAIQMINEVKAVTRNDGFAWWPLFVPLYNIYYMCVMVPAEVGKAKQILGVQQPVRSPVLYFFLFLYALASDVNDLVR
jgi:hypothetical protein